MKMIMIAALICLAGSTSTAQAVIFQKNGMAIDGYDVVAFFSEQKPVKGSSQYTATWNDAKWHFSSQQNLDSFNRRPEKYAPEYGGYCAYGMADGHKAPTEVDTWTIIDDKLYFNYNRNVKEMWGKKTKEYIEKADANWLKLKNTKM